MAPFTTPSSIVFPNLETYTVRSPISHTLVFQTPPRIIVPHLFMIITNRLVEAFLRNNGIFAPKRCTYSDPKRMLNSFKDNAQYVQRQWLGLYQRGGKGFR
ncbi:hypothetical protein GQ457_01G019140 [Hibiscus cannabinus]